MAAGLIINLVLSKLWITLNSRLKSFTWQGDMIAYRSDCTDSKATVRVQFRTKWSFEGWRDVERVCQWKCATGPMSKRFRLSNKHACECWSDCTRKPDTLRAKLCMVCLHMHNNYYMVLCVFLCLCWLFFSVSFVNNDKCWKWFTLYVGQYKQCTLLARLVIFHCWFPTRSSFFFKRKNNETVGKPQKNAFNLFYFWETFELIYLTTFACLYWHNSHRFH